MSILPTLGLFCKGYVTSNCRQSILNVSFWLHTCTFQAILFLGRGNHLTLRRSQLLPSQQSLPTYTYCTFSLVSVITVALFLIVHTLATPLTNFLATGIEWIWDYPQWHAFGQLKHVLCTAAVLILPDICGEFVLHTDVLCYCIGGVLR